MNTKAILAAIVLSALFAGTSAIAGDNDYIATYAVNQTAETFVIKHAFLLTPAVVAVVNEEATSK
ncbi:MAG: hypothetical protein V7749_03310 [Cocleimonas sp.]